MITTKAAGHYQVTGSTRDEIEAGIHTALEAAQEHSMTGSRQGIVIMRHAPDSFTVALSHDVPYGLTVEREGTAVAPEVQAHHALDRGSPGQPDPGDSQSRAAGPLVA